MFKSFRVGSVLGIPLRLDITFLLILPVFAYLIGSEIELLVTLLAPLAAEGIDPTGLTGGIRHWLLGFAAAIGLFVCVALHELGHSVAAKQYGYHIDSITLWLLGGLAKLTEVPRHWYHEFTIAIAGPVVSILCGVIALAPLAVIDGPPVVVFLLAYLGVMNLLLAVFNMLPAFPMDGGRVLRSLLARKRPLPRATKLASEIGKGMAVLLGLWGLVAFNPIVIAIALFIYIAARGEAQQLLFEEALTGVTVSEIMTPIEHLRLVSPRTSIAELFGRMFSERRTSYPVVRDGRPLGLVTLDDAQRVAEIERDAMEVRDIMIPVGPTLSLSTGALDALRLMRDSKRDGLLVVDLDGDLAGYVSQHDVTRAFDVARYSSSWDVAKHRPEAQRN